MRTPSISTSYDSIVSWIASPTSHKGTSMPLQLLIQGGQRHVASRESSADHPAESTAINDATFSRESQALVRGQKALYLWSGLELTVNLVGRPEPRCNHVPMYISTSSACRPGVITAHGSALMERHRLGNPMPA